MPQGYYGPVQNQPSNGSSIFRKLLLDMLTKRQEAAAPSISAASPGTALPPSTPPSISSASPGTALPAMPSPPVGYGQPTSLPTINPVSSGMVRGRGLSRPAMPKPSLPPNPETPAVGPAMIDPMQGGQTPVEGPSPYGQEYLSSLVNGMDSANTPLEQALLMSKLGGRSSIPPPQESGNIFSKLFNGIRRVF